MKRLALLVPLILAPLGAWADCRASQEQAMSCAEGSTWDADASKCVPLTTS